jgi:murein L,D-transpeptidase YafK
MKGGRKAAVFFGLAAMAAGLLWLSRFGNPASGKAGMDETPLALPLKDPRVVIRKRERELRLYDGNELRKRYRVVLGGGTGDKEREGDRRTPEGDFYVCTRNDKSRFHLFMGLSYPAPDDAERGRRSGMISERERDAIVAAYRRRECPPWKTALGGEVGIHGGGTSRDWTLGCVAMEDRDVEELWRALRLGDPVRIEP